MDGHEATIGEIRERGGFAVELGESTRRVDVGEPVIAIGSLMPGGVEVAGEAVKLGAYWDDELAGLGRRVASYGDAMVQVAQRYEADDEAAAESLRIQVPRSEGPR